MTLNRDRAKVGRTGRNLHKWGLIPSSECPCGHPTQTMEHILRQCDLGPKITDRDLLEGNDLALNWAKTWRDMMMSSLTYKLNFESVNCQLDLLCKKIKCFGEIVDYNMAVDLSNLSTFLFISI